MSVNLEKKTTSYASKDEFLATMDTATNTDANTDANEDEDTDEDEDEDEEHRICSRWDVAESYSWDPDTGIAEYIVYEILGGVENLDRETLEQYFDFERYGRDLRLGGDVYEDVDRDAWYWGR